MAEKYIPYFFVAIFIAFPFLWFGVISFITEQAKMSKDLDFKKLIIKGTSNWGSGVINGVSFQGCLRVSYTENEYIFETKRLFGGRTLLIRKDDLDVGPLVSKSFFKPKKISITSSEHSISLFGNLVDEFI